MLIKIPALEIPEENPFLNDALNRFENAEILTQLISTLEEPFVLSIDSKWGSGKTTFIRMWEQYLKNEGYKVIYFNAWENDINEDALSALVAEIKNAIQIAPDQEKSKEIFEKIRSITIRLFKRSLPVVVKLTTAGLLDVNELVENAVSSAAEKLALDSIEDYEKRKEDIKNFKQELEEFTSSLSGESGKPLIFFIDELDRCRPNFAIEVLEKAKHFFNVRNIIFVISIDRKELGHSIKAIYGNEFDTDGYLRRFIDLNYILPTPNLQAYCNFLIERFQFNSYFEKRTHRELRNDREKYIEIAFELFNLVGFSLRTVEQCFSQLSIVLRTIPETHYMYPVPLAFMVLMKNHNPDLYQQLKQKNCTEEDILRYLYSLDPKNIFIANKHLGAVLEAYIISNVSYYLRDESDKKNLQFIKTNYYDKINDPNTPEDEKRRLQDIIYIFDNLGVRERRNVLRTLLEKIDISQRFQ